MIGVLIIIIIILIVLHNIIMINLHILINMVLKLQQYQIMLIILNFIIYLMKNQKKLKNILKMIWKLSMIIII